MPFFRLRAPRPFRDLAHKLEALVSGKLWLQALMGLGLGLGFGMLLGPDVGVVSAERAALITSWIALPGELFLRLIKMVLIPLIVASIIRGLGGTTDVAKLKSLGVKFFLYVLCTSCVAASIGIGMATLIEPGKYVRLPSEHSESVENTVAVPDDVNIIQDLPAAVVELIPANPLAAAMNSEMLGIVIFSIIVGIAFAMRRNEKIMPLLTLLDGILDICMTIVRWAMLLVPLAVFGLIARMVAQVGIQTLLGMGVYVATVIGGLLALLILYLLLILVVARISPMRFFRGAGAVQLLAFSTSSSAAVMPVSVKTAEEEFGVEEESAKIIVPLGATINMDGTALYQSIAILFLAQLSGIELSLVQMILVVVTLVLSSVGAPGTPGVGMVILGGVAANFGIPTAGLVLILGVDRILDMSRTVVNVTGDLTACLIFGRKREGWLTSLKQLH